MAINQILQSRELMRNNFAVSRLRRNEARNSCKPQPGVALRARATNWLASSQRPAAGEAIDGDAERYGCARWDGRPP